MVLAIEWTTTCVDCTKVARKKLLNEKCIACVRRHYEYEQSTFHSIEANIIKMTKSMNRAAAAASASTSQAVAITTESQTNKMQKKYAQITRMHASRNFCKAAERERKRERVRVKK